MKFKDYMKGVGTQLASRGKRMATSKATASIAVSLLGAAVLVPAQFPAIALLAIGTPLLYHGTMSLLKPLNLRWGLGNWFKWNSTQGFNPASVSKGNRASGRKSAKQAAKPARIPEGKAVGDPMTDLLIRTLKQNDFTVTTDWKYSKEIIRSLPEKYDYLKADPDKVNGFVYEGVIHINPKSKSWETPVHEYTHIWAEVVRQKNPDEWKHIVELMKQEKKLWKDVRKAYPHLSSDDEIADEVLATYSGRRGAKRIREYYRDGTDADNALGYLFEALQQFWKQVCGFMHVRFTDKDQIADAVLSDFLKGEKLMKQIDPGKQTLNDRMPLGSVGVKQEDSKQSDNEHLNNSNMETKDKFRQFPDYIISDEQKVQIDKASFKLIDEINENRYPLSSDDINKVKNLRVEQDAEHRLYLQGTFDGLDFNIPFSYEEQLLYVKSAANYKDAVKYNAWAILNHNEDFKEFVVDSEKKSLVKALEAKLIPTIRKGEDIAFFPYNDMNYTDIKGVFISSVDNEPPVCIKEISETMSNGKDVSVYTDTFLSNQDYVFLKELHFDRSRPFYFRAVELKDSPDPGIAVDYDRPFDKFQKTVAEAYKCVNRPASDACPVFADFETAVDYAGKLYEIYHRESNDCKISDIFSLPGIEGNFIAVDSNSPELLREFSDKSRRSRYSPDFGLFSHCDEPPMIVVRASISNDNLYEFRNVAEEFFAAEFSVSQTGANRIPYGIKLPDTLSDCADIVLTRESFPVSLNHGNRPGFRFQSPVSPFVKFDQRGECKQKMLFLDGYAFDEFVSLGKQHRTGLYYPTIEEIEADPDKQQAVAARLGKDWNECTEFEKAYGSAVVFGKASRIECPKERYDAAVEAVRERTQSQTARAFTLEQVETINLASSCNGEMYDDGNLKAFYEQLHAEAVKDLKVPDKWKQDSLQELKDLSEGKTRGQFQGRGIV